MVTEGVRDYTVNVPFKIATLNVRTLKNEENLLELEDAFEDSDVHVLGLSEVRRAIEFISTTKNNHLLAHTTCSGGQRGVGFLVRKEMIKNITGFQSISERIAQLNIEIGTKILRIIQVHAPTSTSSENEIENFYAQLADTINQNKNPKVDTFIIHDFNAQVGKGKNNEEFTLGKYGYGKRNSRGWKLLRFCEEHNLIVQNTLFKKREGRTWTWISPNQEFKAQIDYIITTSRIKYVTNCQATNFRYNSDHRLAMCELNLSYKNVRQNKSIKNSIITKDSASAYEIQLRKLLTHGKTNNITEHIRKATSTVNRNKPQQKPNTLPQDIRNLINEREKIECIKNKSRTDKIKLNVLCKLVKGKIREFSKGKKNDMIGRILDTTKSIKSIKKNLRLGKSWTVQLTDKAGIKHYNRDSINRIATNFFRELYREEGRIDLPEINLKGEEKIPEFLIEEVEQITKNLKNNKANGHDRITNEQIKYGGKSLNKKLTELFNNILYTQTIPPEFNLSDIILIYKKGDKSDINNYRPITLSTALSKIFSKLIESRVRTQLNQQQPREQAGFRKNYSTTDHLHSINQLIQKSNEYQLDVHLAFIDYTKAFDSLRHGFLLTALLEQGVPKILVEIIKKMYTNLKARIITDKMGDYFDINRGVKQGDLLSPLLFICALEQIFRTLDWSNRGILVGGERLSNLRFADDVVIIANNVRELTEMINEISKLGKQAGLDEN